MFAAECLLVMKASALNLMKIRGILREDLALIHAGKRECVEA